MTKRHHFMLVGPAFALSISACSSSPAASVPSNPDSTPAPTSPDVDGSDDAATASAVCGALRTYVNELVDNANDAIDGISTVAPEQRLDRVLDGFDAALATIERQRTVFADLELPGAPERDAVRGELIAGLDDAAAELTDERADVASRADEFATGSAQGIAGTWFTAVEKVMSVSEPEIYKYERVEFKQAFLDEPDCRNVIQQFEISGFS
jgi:hypothetical protein